MPLPFKIDWKNPDYRAVYEWRIDRIARIRKDPSVLPTLKAFYARHPAQFIIDWGMTFDPRQADIGRPSWVPFLLFPKQEDWVDWFLDLWQSRKPGITEKSRDMGMSWLTVGVAATLCMMRTGVVAGFGSRKEDLVDKIGDPKALFWKAREFVGSVPSEFRGTWDRTKHAPHLRIIFPDTDSAMTGEAGDNIGRGDRTSFYFVDESAHIERPQMIEASLSNTTNCRMDLSSINGLANPFAQKRFGGRIAVFTFHWRDDPRKGEDWYEDQQYKLDPVTLAQEVDIDYSASVEGVVIPNAWIQSAIDAHKKLGITPTGKRFGALDVADEGRDTNAFCGAHGIVIEHIEEWSGKGGDIFATVQKTFMLCDEYGYDGFRFDSDGLGAGVRGDARIINETRDWSSRKLVEPFRGSEAVINPTREDVPGRKNEDFFANRKAQAWWGLRDRFKTTHRAVTAKAEGKDFAFDADAVISISTLCGKYLNLVTELSQPTYSVNAVGKIVIDKAPDGTKSPNLADAVMIEFAETGNRPMIITDAMLAEI